MPTISSWCFGQLRGIARQNYLPLISITLKPVPQESCILNFADHAVSLTVPITTTPVLYLIPLWEKGFTATPALMALADMITQYKQSPFKLLHLPYRDQAIINILMVFTRLHHTCS